MKSRSVLASILAFAACGGGTGPNLAPMPDGAHLPADASGTPDSTPSPDDAGTPDSASTPDAGITPDAPLSLDAPSCIATPEVCDGVDNDCNGTIDDGLTAPACALQDGVCSGAVKTCGGAQGWLACNAGTYFQHATDNGLLYQVTEATCDDADNDCDGSIDEPAACAPTGSPTWQQLTPITTRTLRGLWGSSASNIWAVGDGGTVLRFNGTQWSAVTSNTALDLKDVWGSSANDVWAVGTGVVIHWDGTAWSVVPGRTGEATSVWGTAANNVYVTHFAPSYGSVEHWNGTTWTIEQTAGAFFSTIHGSSASNIWATGPVFVAPRTWNGTAWSTWPTVVSYIRSVWVPSTNLAWGVGDEFDIKKFDGTSWQDVASPISGGNAMAYAVWGRTTSDVWAVGSRGTGNIGIIHYDGAGWQLSGPSTTLNQTAFDVWGTSATNVWVVGTNGTILHYAPN